jgi:hypothetical protein
MKRRHRYVLNLFSLSLLAFALYLNFFKAEPTQVSVPAEMENSAKPGSMQFKAESKTLSVNHAPTFILK